MNQFHPTVSVLMAVHNSEHFVSEAINSILCQTFRDLELIIINDGSTDRSFEILKEFEALDKRIRIYSRSNQGITATANELVEKSYGKYLSIMDHDDIKMPTCIEKQVYYLEKTPNCAAVGTLTRWIDNNGDQIITGNASRRSELKSINIAADFSVYPPELPYIYNPSALIRAEAMKNVGNYRAQFIYSHDFDLWLRLIKIGEIHQINEELVSYRIHGQNTTIIKGKEILYYEIIAILSYLSRLIGKKDQVILDSFKNITYFDAVVDQYLLIIGHIFPVRDYINFRFSEESLDMLKNLNNRI